MDIIKLKNGLKFIVLDKIVYEGNKYLYLSSYDDDMNIIFAKFNGNLIEPIDDGNLIIKLMQLVKKDAKNS